MTLNWQQPPGRWAYGPQNRFLRDRGYLHPTWCLIKVTDGPHWDALDDLLRATGSPGRRPTLCRLTGYLYIRQTHVPAVVDKFTKAGALHRLDCRLLPARHASHREAA